MASQPHSGCERTNCSVTSRMRLRSWTRQGAARVFVEMDHEIPRALAQRIVEGVDIADTVAVAVDARLVRSDRAGRRSRSRRASVRELRRRPCRRPGQHIAMAGSGLAAGSHIQAGQRQHSSSSGHIFQCDLAGPDAVPQVRAVAGDRPAPSNSRPRSGTDCPNWCGGRSARCCPRRGALPERIAQLRLALQVHDRARIHSLSSLLVGLPRPSAPLFLSRTGRLLQSWEPGVQPPGNSGAKAGAERCRAERNEVVVEIVADRHDDGGGDAEPRAAPGEAFGRERAVPRRCPAR